MKRWIRAWGTTALAWGLVLVIGGAAIAGAGGGSVPKSSHGQEVSALARGAEATDADQTDAPDPEGSPAGEPADGDTHGACVSHWAHEARDHGLGGSDFGHFVSEVAQSEETGADCDFSEALEAAKEGSSTSTHGKSAEEHGKSGQEHGNSGQHAPSGS